jgi:hypothetical protein
MASPAQMAHKGRKVTLARKGRKADHRPNRRLNLRFLSGCRRTARDYAELMAAVVMTALMAVMVSMVGLALLALLALLGLRELALRLWSSVKKDRSGLR